MLPWVRIKLLTTLDQGLVWQRSGIWVGRDLEMCISREIKEKKVRKAWR